MRYIHTFKLFESKASSSIDQLVDNYSSLPEELDKKSEVIGEYNQIQIRIVNPKILSLYNPEWEKYKGSHHWGKKTSYIPEDEIWIVNGLDPDSFRKILNHEIIEREMMRALQEEIGMDTDSSWSQSHHYLKKIGF